VNKCTVYLFNIPESAMVPTLTSIAWSYDNQGPVKGNIATVVMRRENDTNHLLCYDVPQPLWDTAPEHIKNILKPRKYLGVPTNAQLDNSLGKNKIINKLKQRIGLVATKSDNIQETMIAHNMLVSQVATFSPLCITMTLRECASIDKLLLKTYQHRLNYKTHDAKHAIFISKKRGGIGVRCFLREFVGALMRDVEVYISNEDSYPSHALMASLEEAAKLELWKSSKSGRIPVHTAAANRLQTYSIAGIKTIQYTSFDEPPEIEISYNHTHLMNHAIKITCALGFILKDLKKELLSRFMDELIDRDRNAKSLANSKVSTRASLGPILGDGNGHFFKYSMMGHVYRLCDIILEEAIKDLPTHDNILTNHTFELD